MIKRTPLKVTGRREAAPTGDGRPVRRRSSNSARTSTRPAPSDRMMAVAGDGNTANHGTYRNPPLPKLHWHKGWEQ